MGTWDTPSSRLPFKMHTSLQTRPWDDGMCGWVLVRWLKWELAAALGVDTPRQRTHSREPWGRTFLFGQLKAAWLESA